MLMPLYEYQCNDYGEAFEKVVLFSEADLKPVCPDCTSMDTNKNYQPLHPFVKLNQKLSTLPTVTS